MTLKTPLRLAALFAFCLLSACVHGRYTLPISPWDAQAVYPSVVSVAQSQGHQAWLNGDNLQVELQDGTHYWWYPQQDGTVALAIKFAQDVPPAQEQARLDAAKATADRLWQDALAARQQYGAGAAPVVVAVPVFAGSGAGVGAGGPPPGAPAGDCRVGSRGQRACGYDCRVGSNGQPYCAATPDGRCALNSDGSFSCGRNCRLEASGFHACD